MKRDLTLTLREACLARGINPDDTGYKVPKQRILAVDRIIPGVADRESPSLAKNDSAKRGQARKMYTRTSAANDKQTILMSDHPISCYVIAFCRLNNLKE